MTIAGLRGCNIRKLVAVDVLQSRLDLAKKYGATHTVNPADGDAGESAYEITEGRFFDVVVELTGSLRGLQTSLSIVKYPHVNGFLTNPFSAAAVCCFDV
jgi:threonine dehydrogenase-like Zn-dependent dehydrogenase